MGKYTYHTITMSYNDLLEAVGTYLRDVLGIEVLNTTACDQYFENEMDENSSIVVDVTYFGAAGEQ